MLTGKLNVRKPCFLERVKLDWGTAACNMHARDCHWFLLRESPTNSIFFPFILLKKSRPSKLNAVVQYISIWLNVHLHHLFTPEIYLGNIQLIGFHL